MQVYGIVVLSSNDVLLTTGGSRPKQLSFTTGNLTDTAYDISPFISTAIHITSDNKVVVGGYSGKLGRNAVFVMNEQGMHETVYEYDQRNQSILTYPRSLISTRNGNIFVADYYPGKSSSGKVVVLEQGGGIINEFTGNLATNKDKPFKPIDIVVSPKDNVVVKSEHDPVLQILNNQGFPVTYYNINIIGIFYPYCLAFNTSGQLCIDSGRAEGSTTNEAMLYEVNISGF